MRLQFVERWFAPAPLDGSPRNAVAKRMFWVGLVVRLAYVTLAHTYRISPYEDHFKFGCEAARIARAVVTGHGYADPFMPVGTGPTAWLPPLFPLMIAMCFKLFGVYTSLAAWSVLALDCLFSAATSPAVYEIGARCFNRRVAIWSGWIWALYPAAMQYAVKWVWEMTLTAMLFSWVLVLALRVRGAGSDEANPQRLSRWLLFGFLWGLIALCNPALCLFLPVCGVWMLLGARDLKRAFRMAVASGLLFFACLVPWTWRNWKVFHTWIPVRGNFGVELYLGNTPAALGLGWGISIDSQPDLKRYAAIGEVAYVKEHKAMAMANIKSDPKHFLRLTIKRAYFFWAGVPHPFGKSSFLEYIREFNYGFASITGLLGLALAWKRGIPAARLFAWAFALLPLTYYAVTSGARFRHPLEPLIVVLTVFLFQSAQPRSVKGRGGLSHA
jgi:4-amino-4-deoxy-L-arabinose transferase-like glycosyltransferase